MTHPIERDWMIVAPWWRWTDPATVPAGTPVTPDPAKGRLSTPIFQKYDSASLVTDFMKDPQRCLTFVDDDLVHAVRARSGASTSKAGKLFRITASTQSGAVVDQEYVPDGTDTRKIFLNTHKRFYLAVCDVRCDGPGFPKVARNKICQAGFVVRRRTLTAPGNALDEVKPIVKRLTTSRSKLARVNELSEIEQLALSEATGGKTTTSAKLESLLKTRASLQDLLATERDRFDAWVKRFNVVPQLQGWFPSPKGFANVGYWGTVSESPDALGTESSFPLYPLIPDQNDPDHDGQFGTIYFGLLPVSSHDCDETGRARFDDQEYYEVRCWVTRHLVPHDPDQPCPCPDGIFWSRPTRPYKLAPHFDLAGTSNQPITIQLPDLNALAAQAKPTLGVGFAKPPGSLMLQTSTDGTPKKKDSGRSASFEICFFPIPLITIVATFVFQLFLPVVMFVFQLWWMLALKFCLPPEIEVGAAISAEIGLGGQIGIKADVDLDAEIEARIDGAVQLSVNKAFDPATAASLLATYSPIALANLEVGASSAAAATDTDPDTTAPAGADVPSAVANLDYEPEVTHA